MNTASVRVQPFSTLPASTIMVRDGRVVWYEKWTLWNMEPWKTCLIVRREDGTFFSSIGDPEHGGGSLDGNLEQVLTGLHPEIKQMYVALFGLEDADYDAISKLGFGGYEVINL